MVPFGAWLISLIAAASASLIAVESTRPTPLTATCSPVLGSRRLPSLPQTATLRMSAKGYAHVLGDNAIDSNLRTLNHLLLMTLQRALDVYSC
jgi:hypothetical protein